jgi:hypothetical protein
MSAASNIAEKPWPDCPTCGGRGYTQSDNPSLGFDNRFACRTCPALWAAVRLPSMVGYESFVVLNTAMCRVLDKYAEKGEPPLDTLIRICDERDHYENRTRTLRASLSASTGGPLGHRVGVVAPPASEDLPPRRRA